MHFSHSYFTKLKKAYQCTATRWRYKTLAYPIPASTQCLAIIGPPAKCFRCCIAKKEEKKAGEGVGDWLESPIENPFNFCVFFLFLFLFFFCFFACVVAFYGFFFFFFFFFGGGGGKLLI